MMGAMLACAVHTAPKVPRYEGTRVERYEQALYYYQERMGLQDYSFEIKVVEKYPTDDRCAWVQNNGWKHVQFGFVDAGFICNGMRPERLSLHEMCHVRWMHTDKQINALMTIEEMEVEVKRCMSRYGKEVE
jgi:hypothetical protein